MGAFSIKCRKDMIGSTEKDMKTIDIIKIKYNTLVIRYLILIT